MFFIELVATAVALIPVGYQVDKVQSSLERRKEIMSERRILKHFAEMRIEKRKVKE